MNSSSAQRYSIDIRRPEGLRVASFALSGVIGVLSLVKLVTSLTSDDASGWVAWAFILVASINGLVVWAQSASTHGSDLWVRNYGWRRVIPRSTIVAFAIEPTNRVAIAKRIMVVVRGRTQPIVIGASVRGPIDTQTVDEWMVDLNKWLRTPVA
jgi:hypothetical protein